MAKTLDVEVINPIPEAPAAEVLETAAIETAPEKTVAEKIEAAAESVEAGGEKAEGGEPPAYTPNRKFKFTDDDGEKEAEFEEWVGPILNKDNEEKFRDLFSKAHGLDFVKNKRDKLALEKGEIEGQFSHAKNVLQDWLGLREKDLGLFLEKAGVTEEQVAQYLIQKGEAQAKLKDLPPHLQNLYNENIELKRRTRDYEAKLANAQNTGFDATSQTLSLQVQTVLSRPEITAIANEFDTRRGEPGAFFDMVKREGELEFLRTEKNLSAEEAVSRALKTLALSVQAPSQGVTPNGTVATPKVVVANKTAVIPNVGGGSAPTGSKKPRSIDDLRKMAKEMASSNR